MGSVRTNGYIGVKLHEALAVVRSPGSRAKPWQSCEALAVAPSNGRKPKSLIAPSDRTDHKDRHDILPRHWPLTTDRHDICS